MSNIKQNQCAHENCTCPAPEGKYCTSYCESGKGAASGGCGCGHPGRAGKAVASAAQAR